jgi:hypothetical protein
MTAITNTVSTFIDSQLPQFIREDNPNFGAFIKAYYQWMETSADSAVIAQTKSLLSYKDIDQTTDAFIQYFINDFLPYFPNDVALDERKLIKAARNFYQKKGSIESIQFLFRVLYNKEADIYFPKDYILKASDGKWTLPQALRLVLDPSNLNFDINLLVGRQGLGSQSNASCIIEAAIKTVDQGLGIELVEVYISNLNQNFTDLENLNVVYGFDSNNNPLVFTEKIISSISNIVINPKKRGLKYKGFIQNGLGQIVYQGDPVVISGGLQSGDTQAAKAVAFVGNVTSGSITGVSIAYGGTGYRLYPNSNVHVINGPTDNTGAGANIIVQGFDTLNSTFVLVNTDSIEYKMNAPLNSANYAFTNIANANINTAIGAAMSFSNLQFAALTSMNVINGGGGFTEVPTINVTTNYYTDFVNDLANIADFPDVANNIQTMSDLGLVANVVVNLGGSGYSNVTDRIVVPSCIGYNAAFTFTTGANGTIANVNITSSGEGYIELPTNLLVVNSANVAMPAAGVGASLTAYGFGQGAILNVAVNQIGQITDFRIVSRGFDYISTPNVSLRVADLVINPIGNNNSFVTDSRIFQGANINIASWTAYIDSYNVTSSVLRVYNYQGALNITANLISTTVNAQINTATTSNVTIYGNGLAQANAIFLNGLIQYPGFYLTTDGMLSADQHLQDGTTYHNYSYVVVVEKALIDFKNTLMKLVHPAGTSMLGKFSVIADISEGIQTEGNVNIIPVVAGSVSTNAFAPTGIITGLGTSFGAFGNVGDLIVFNTADSNQWLQAKQIISVTNTTSIVVESNTAFSFDGPVSIQNTSNVITANGIFGVVTINDIVKINANGNVITSNVLSVTQNNITVNTVFNANISNIVMIVYPTIVNASYSIVRTAS